MNRLQFMISNCSLCSKTQCLREYETLPCAKRINVVNKSIQSKNKPTIWGWFIQPMGSLSSLPLYFSTCWSPRWPCQATRCAAKDAAFFCLTFRPDGPEKVSPGAQGLPREQKTVTTTCAITTREGGSVELLEHGTSCWKASSAEDSPKDVEHQAESCVAGEPGSSFS